MLLKARMLVYPGSDLQSLASGVASTCLPISYYPSFLFHSSQHCLLACFSTGLIPTQTELEGGDQVSSPEAQSQRKYLDTPRHRDDLQDRFLPGRAACLPTGSVSRGEQGAGLRPRHMAQIVMGIMLKSQLEQAAGFLDQQINLRRASVWTGESQVVRAATISNPACQTQGLYILHLGAHSGWVCH